MTQRDLSIWESRGTAYLKDAKSRGGNLFVTLKTIRGKYKQEGNETNHFIYHYHEYLAVGDARQFLDLIMPLNQLHTEKMVEIRVQNEFSYLDKAYLNHRGVLTNIRFLGKNKTGT